MFSQALYFSAIVALLVLICGTFSEAASLSAHPEEGVYRPDRIFVRLHSQVGSSALGNGAEVPSNTVYIPHILVKRDDNKRRLKHYHIKTIKREPHNSRHRA
ncbi:unnamed protein product [Allacma fusca]|uniref:Secreted protein n=1 Tax=Allacma fusca TaxID=39272 RepID=A0A8J2L7S8_9HEXA|nr:unnamed protein product [Allacma fusca]